MPRHHKLMYGLAAAIFIIAAALVAWGVSTHSEPTFDHEETWQGPFPLKVKGESYGAGHFLSQHRRHLEHAVDSVNDRMGFDVFEVSHDEGAEVRVVLGAPVEEGWADTGGHASLTLLEGRITQCEVETRNTGTVSVTEMVLVHELGHCLGLGHDNFESSIMYGYTTETAFGEFPPRFTDDDREAVRERYMR